MNNPIRVQHRLESTDCHKPSPKSPILWIYIYRYKYILSFMATCGPVSCGIRIFATQVFNDFPSFSVAFFLPGIPPFSPCFQRFSFVFFLPFSRHSSICLHSPLFSTIFLHFPCFFPPFFLPESTDLGGIEAYRHLFAQWYIPPKKVQFTRPPLQLISRFWRHTRRPPPRPPNTHFVRQNNFAQPIGWLS